MGLELVLVIFVLIVGICLLSFAPKIGMFIYNSYGEFTKQSYDNWARIWVKPYIWLGSKFYIWLLRIIGAAFVCGSTFILLWVYIFSH